MLTVESKNMTADIDDITGDQIEAYLKKKLRIVGAVDEAARTADKVAWREERERDRVEWDSLDESSKGFLKSYLAGKEQ